MLQPPNYGKGAALPERGVWLQVHFSLSENDHSARLTVLWELPSETEKIQWDKYLTLSFTTFDSCSYLPSAWFLHGKLLTIITQDYINLTTHVKHIPVISESGSSHQFNGVQLLAPMERDEIVQTWILQYKSEMCITFTRLQLWKARDLWWITSCQKGDFNFILLVISVHPNLNLYLYLNHRAVIRSCLFSVLQNY